MSLNIRTRRITTFDSALQRLLAEFVRRIEESEVKCSVIDWSGSRSIKICKRVVVKAFLADEQYPSLDQLGRGLVIGYSSDLEIWDPLRQGRFLPYFPEEVNIIRQLFRCFTISRSHELAAHWDMIQSLLNSVIAAAERRSN